VTLPRMTWRFCMHHQGMYLLSLSSLFSSSFLDNPEWLNISRPCYQGLHNNVSTPEMKLRTHDWKPNTPDFVTHDVLATYIQDTAASNDILSAISSRTRVNKVEKKDTKWEVSTSKLVEEAGEKEIRNSVQVCALAKVRKR
jgi:hypothetical protein